MNTTRSSILSTFLSLLAPGLGHVHEGRVVQGLAFTGGTVAVGMLGTVAVLSTPLWARLALAGAGAWFLALWVAAAISALRGARDASSSQAEWRRWYVYALLIVVTFASLATWTLAVREKVVQVFRIPSGSMDPTIPPGARVLVDKVSYATGPVRRGDVVVFVNPDERYQDYIKRVVALPGDTVEMRDDDVFVNGARLLHERAGGDARGDLVDETNGGASYRIRLAPTDDEKPRAFAAMKVPSGHCFLLGDNRHHSVDSRDIGPVPLTDIVGRVDRAW